MSLTTLTVYDVTKFLSMQHYEILCERYFTILYASEKFLVQVNCDTGIFLYSTLVQKHSLSLTDWKIWYQTMETKVCNRMEK